MFLEQICPGQVNPQPHAIDTFVWKSTRYIVRFLKLTFPSFLTLTLSCAVYACVHVCVFMRLCGKKVYATGSKVVIYADPAKLVQIVAVPLDEQTSVYDTYEPVTAVAGSRSTGQLAVACGTRIGVFEYQTNAGQAHPWCLRHIIQVSSPVACVDWSHQGHILAAGEELSIWTPTSDSSRWTKNWSAR
ncbi:hypothetical protein BX666DRAFT_250075 [Dichotomocladium elegans]|nr:hypothetical protein BX666DRAFT_250075 [Dichotomocladium elegans]